MNVAFIVFNRPRQTERAFERIAAAKPGRLFIIADGPRTPDEVARCAEVRAIATAVDWPCEVRTNFSEENLGCGVRPATGLDWVFEQVDEAIILEDDCLPSKSFFTYCQDLLVRYRDETRVMHIGATNYLDGRRFSPHSYHFSKYPHGAAWATWRRAWRAFDYSLGGWPEARDSAPFNDHFTDHLEKRFWSEKFDYLRSGVRDIWDYQWLYAIWASGGVAITSSENMVQNIGFGPDATHTVHPTSISQPPAVELHEIVHPTEIIVNEAADRYTFDVHHGGAEYRRRHSAVRRFGRRLAGKGVRVLGKLRSQFLGR